MDNSSKLRTLLSEGCISAFYTQKDFVKLYLCFDIDMVKFSFAEIGKGGKGFDIYMDLLTFALWAKDVESGRMFQTLLQEKERGEKYPSSYKYMTGTNGEKSIGFCQSSVADSVCLNGGVGKSHKLIPIPKQSLRRLALIFTVCTRRYMDGLEVLAVEGSTKSSSYHNKEGSAENQKNPNTTSVTVSDSEVRAYKLKSLSKLETFELNGKTCFKMQAAVSDGTSYEVHFLSETIKKCSAVFNSLVEHLTKNPQGTPLSVNASMRTYKGVPQLVFKSFVREGV